MPLSLNEKLCAAGAGCPCPTEKVRLEAPTCSEHGGSTVNVTEIVCEFPCTGVLDPSVAVIVISVVYVLAVNPAILALTVIGVD